MTNINRLQSIKILSAQEVYDAMPDEDLYDKDTGRYLSIYDILQAIDVDKTEIDYVQSLSHEELGLLD
ncbi:hypothetical protein [Vibrio phage vB_VibM_10AMN]|uniref:Uncharacterized protein n=1 Tax=Staphylococcus phage vB_VibM_10AMN12 TaxID=3076785 RepID=A0AA96R6P3_9CAUD|nr:hypothetical protein [Vibrio phage vB_VibM_10AMN]WNO47547.1 hypothetical protein [Staphylococcus phage vB_VibM_10AMN12]